MKKLTILAVLALVAGASCTKSIPVSNNSPDASISFNPVSYTAGTKAEYFGEQNAAYTGDGATYEKFLAYAAYTETDAAAPSENFFPAAGVECLYNSTDDYWAPSTNYYWPKDGYLTFRAFSPSVWTGGTGYAGTVANNWTATAPVTYGITITGFTAGVAMDKQVDVLYSDVEAYKQRSDYTDATGVPYDDDDDSAFAHNGVNIRFRHALSAVQFYVMTDQDYSTGTQTHAFKVKKVEVLNVNYKGEFHENRTSATVNTYANAAAGSITFNSDNAVTASPYWVPVDSNASTDETTYTPYENATGQNVTDAAAAIGGLMIPIPQNLTHAGTRVNVGDSPDVCVRVTYDYTFTNNGTPHNYTGLISEFSISGRNGTYESGSAGAYTVNQWLINHKYNYTLVFKLDPIIFDPKVEVWVNVRDINIDLPAQN